MANSTHTTTLSRRRALAGLASTAAVAIPATALAASAEPDAALIDFGKTLAGLIEEYEVAAQKERDATARWVRPSPPAALLVTEKDFPGIGGCRPQSRDGDVLWSKIQTAAALKRADKPWKIARLNELQRSHAEYEASLFTSERDCGLRQAADELDGVCGRIDALTDRIRALRATTLQGFAVKALAITFHASHLWREEVEAMDWGDQLIRELVDEAVDHLPETIAA